MNIYISQVVGNEPMAAAFSGVAVVMTLGLISKRSVPSKWSCFFLGVVVGLGVLTKPTPFLLIPPILIGIGYLVFVNCEPGLKSTLILAHRAAVLIGAVALVAGWYYVRNYILMGALVSGGMEPPVGRRCMVAISVLQDPPTGDGLWSMLLLSYLFRCTWFR